MDCIASAAGASPSDGRPAACHKAWSEGVAKRAEPPLLTMIVAAEAVVTTVVRRVVMKAVNPCGLPGENTVAV